MYGVARCPVDRILAHDEELAALARRELTGVAGGGVELGAGAFLARDNTVLDLAGVFSAPLAGVGVDFPRAPPAEVFLGHVRSPTARCGN